MVRLLGRVQKRRLRIRLTHAVRRRQRPRTNRVGMCMAWRTRRRHCVRMMRHTLRRMQCPVIVSVRLWRKACGCRLGKTRNGMARNLRSRSSQLPLRAMQRSRVCQPPVMMLTRSRPRRRVGNVHRGRLVCSSVVVVRMHVVAMGIFLRCICVLVILSASDAVGVRSGVVVVVRRGEGAVVWRLIPVVLHLHDCPSIRTSHAM